MTTETQSVLWLMKREPRAHQSDFCKLGSNAYSILRFLRDPGLPDGTVSGTNPGKGGWSGISTAVLCSAQSAGALTQETPGAPCLPSMWAKPRSYGFTPEIVFLNFFLMHR